jgi:hypothetical protein
LPEDSLLIAEERWRHAWKLGLAHYEMTKRMLRWHEWLGGLAAALAALVALPIFGTLKDNPAIGWKIAAGVVAALAAVLAALQTRLKFGERAEKHKVAAAHYGTIRRHLEIVACKYEKAPDDPGFLDELEQIGNEMARLPAETPYLKPSADKRGAQTQREHECARVLDGTPPPFPTFREGGRVGECANEFPKIARTSRDPRTATQ